ncbi:hypothetical protein PVAP13_2NG051501 [Panicum virgatum]|uniref:Uncharacterized protein n=1 Tax=Panicum virgatum TaxID=38727 RepID=A0A8T0V5G6_PANVG|nr:hypothetical protein PVAP13_2NG051501 [Panicum virgatum]
MSLSVHRRLGDAAAAAKGASTHRHHAPAAASVSASATSSYSLCYADTPRRWPYSSSPEGADPALPSPLWQPLPRSLPMRRRAGTSTSVPAPRTRRTTARMTWLPERTPRYRLAGGDGALSSPNPRGLTRENEYLRWLGSLRSRTEPRGAGASAPPSPTASSAARPLGSRPRNAPAASTPPHPAPTSARPSSPALQRVGPRRRPPRALGTAPPPLSALATASLGVGARRLPPRLTGTRSASLRPIAKLPTGAGSALPPLQKPTPDAPSMPTDLTPPPRFLAAFARITEVLCVFGPDRVGALPEIDLSTTYHIHGSLSLVQQLCSDSGLPELLSGTGLMAATSISPNGYTHRVSSVCSRLCACLATFVFIHCRPCMPSGESWIHCRHCTWCGWLVAVCYMLSVWIEGDPAAYGAYTRVWTAIKYLWQGFKWSGQRDPLLP